MCACSKFYSKSGIGITTVCIVDCVECICTEHFAIVVSHYHFPSNNITIVRIRYGVSILSDYYFISHYFTIVSDYGFVSNDITVVSDYGFVSNDITIVRFRYGVIIVSDYDIIDDDITTIRFEQCVIGLCDVRGSDVGITTVRIIYCFECIRIKYCVNIVSYYNIAGNYITTIRIVYCFGVESK